jgi:hypothetical protein
MLMHPKHMFSLEWPITLYFQLDSYATEATYSLSNNRGYNLRFRELPIFSGPRDLNTGLWRINLKQTNNHIPEIIENNVYESHSTGALVHYLHKALFSPAKSAMLQAVKDGHLITWPGLPEDTINKHLKLTPATAMGHMNQPRPKHTSHLEGNH